MPPVNTAVKKPAQGPASPHTVTVTEQKDPSHVYRFLVECRCGWQGRCHSEPEAQQLKHKHLAAQVPRP